MTYARPVGANWFIAFPMQVEGLQLSEPPRRVRLFADSDLHCTIAFLGSVGEEAARAAWLRALELVRGEPLQGTFREVAPLGHPRRPSALAALVARGAERLAAITTSTRAPMLAAAGAPPDERPALPHVTFARIQRRASHAERRAALAWAQSLTVEGARFETDSVALYTWASDRERRLFQIVEKRSLSS